MKIINKLNNLLKYHFYKEKQLNYYLNYVCDYSVYFSEFLQFYFYSRIYYHSKNYLKNF